MRTLADTWTLARRSLRHITRSPDTIITVLLMPIALMLLFVYVWGGAMGGQTGSVSYIDFIVPGIIVMTVLSGICVRCGPPQHGRAEWHHQSLQDDAGRAVVDPGRAGRIVHLVQPLLVPGGPAGSVRDGLPAAGRRDGMVGLCRDPAVVHALDDVAGHLLRPAGQDDGGGRRIQLHPASARVHQPLIRADDLHDAALAGLRRASTDDSRGRDDAFTVGRTVRPARRSGRPWHGSSASSSSRILRPWRSTNARRSWSTPRPARSL